MKIYCFARASVSHTFATHYVLFEIWSKNYNGFFILNEFYMIWYDNKVFCLKMVNFIYSEKATKILRNLHLFWLALVPVKKGGYFAKFLWPSQNIWTLNIVIFNFYVRSLIKALKNSDILRMIQIFGASSTFYLTFT